MPDIVEQLFSEAFDWWMEAGDNQGNWAEEMRTRAQLLDDAGREILRLRGLLAPSDVDAPVVEADAARPGLVDEDVVDGDEAPPAPQLVVRGNGTLGWSDKPYGRRFTAMPTPAVLPRDGAPSSFPFPLRDSTERVFGREVFQDMRRRWFDHPFRDYDNS